MVKDFEKSCTPFKKLKPRISKTIAKIANAPTFVSFVNFTINGLNIFNTLEFTGRLV
jgi:hypothetical protein